MKRNPLGIQWNLAYPLHPSQYKALQKMAPTGRPVSLNEVAAWFEAAAPQIEATNPGIDRAGLWRIAVAWWAKASEERIRHAVRRARRLQEHARLDEIKAKAEQTSDPLENVEDPELRKLLGMDE